MPEHHNIRDEFKVDHVSSAQRINASQFAVDCVDRDGRKLRLVLPPEEVFHFVLQVMSHHPSRTATAKGYTDYSPNAFPMTAQVGRDGKKVHLNLLYQLARQDQVACWPISLAADEALQLGGEMLRLVQGIAGLDYQAMMDKVGQFLE